MHTVTTFPAQPSSRLWCPLLLVLLASPVPAAEVEGGSPAPAMSSVVLTIDPRHDTTRLEEDGITIRCAEEVLENGYRSTCLSIANGSEYALVVSSPDLSLDMQAVPSGRRFVRPLPSTEREIRLTVMYRERSGKPPRPGGEASHAWRRERSEDGDLAYGLRLGAGTMPGIQTVTTAYGTDRSRELLSHQEQVAFTVGSLPALDALGWEVQVGYLRGTARGAVQASGGYSGYAVRMVSDAATLSPRLRWPLTADTTLDAGPVGMLGKSSIVLNADTGVEQVLTGVCRGYGLATGLRTNLLDWMDVALEGGYTRYVVRATGPSVADASVVGSQFVIGLSFGLRL